VDALMTADAESDVTLPLRYRRSRFSRSLTTARRTRASRAPRSPAPTRGRYLGYPQRHGHPRRPP
jgi:hypothetical protein